MKYFIIIKENSVRLPNKNFKKLGNLELWKHLILELSNQQFYIDTDSFEILEKCQQFNWVTTYQRSKEHIDLEINNSFKVSPALLMIERFLDEYVDDENEIIVTPHVTSPFIKLSTIEDASKMLSMGYDSVLACTKHYEFAYIDNKPINFDPNVIQKTQDLNPIIMGNGAFFIFTKKMFKKYKNRTGKNPYFYPLNFKESIEIDTEEDFELAKRFV